MCLTFLSNILIATGSSRRTTPQFKVCSCSSVTKKAYASNGKGLFALPIFRALRWKLLNENT
jgi:hypothetical protein